ncbi:hypothetical protein GCM10022286_30860 [Gryllotalpicola daejeonensis]|uniref:Uncharacterized protein n=1 Tax=Gryllotalpicola daejeonensis TaxID=993087 RepID=A0ABP7ZNS3_9MICO
MRAAHDHGALILELADHLRSANHPGVASLLHSDVVLTVDSGEGARAVASRAQGRCACAGELVRIALGAAEPAADPAVSVVVTVEELNGAPGLVIRARGAVVGVIVAAARDGLIGELWAVLNPEKFGGVAGMSQPGGPFGHY